MNSYFLHHLTTDKEFEAGSGGGGRETPPPPRFITFVGGHIFEKGQILAKVIFELCIMKINY